MLCREHFSVYEERDLQFPSTDIDNSCTLADHAVKLRLGGNAFVGQKTMLRIADYL